jgi:hypothetical protein
MVSPDDGTVVVVVGETVVVVDGNTVVVVVGGTMVVVVVPPHLGSSGFRSQGPGLTAATNTSNITVKPTDIPIVWISRL